MRAGPGARGSDTRVSAPDGWMPPEVVLLGASVPCVGEEGEGGASEPDVPGWVLSP